jgi:hypothetical protein
MKRRRRHRLTTKKRFVGLFVGAIVCLCGFAFTATITVGASKAADGAGVIVNSSFSIASIQYQLDSSTPTKIASVTVTFSGTAPADARASIGGTWSNACSISGLVFTCAFGTLANVPSNSTTTLRVVATS